MVRPAAATSRKSGAKNGQNGHTDDDDLMAALQDGNDDGDGSGDDDVDVQAPAPAGRKGKAAAKASESKIIEIPKIRVAEIVIPVIGTSPLIHHKFSEKAKKEMLDKQMGKAKAKKAAKDPIADFIASLYTKDDVPAESYENKKTKKTMARGKFVFPSLAFKAAAVDACRYASGITMTMARGAFFVVGEFVDLKCDDPIMREDVVRIGGMTKTTDLRYRGEFKSWSAEIKVRFNQNAVTAEQIINLFNLAGFHVGIGEWRMEKGGINGTFEVDMSKSATVSGGDA